MRSHAMSVSRACSLLEKKKTAVSDCFLSAGNWFWEWFCTVVSRRTVSKFTLMPPKWPASADIAVSGKYIAWKKRRIYQIPIRPLRCCSTMVWQKYINPPKNVASSNPKPHHFPKRIERTQPIDSFQQSVFAAACIQSGWLARMGRSGLVKSKGREQIGIGEHWL